MKITVKVKTYGPAKVRGEHTIPGVTALHLTNDGLVVDYDNGLRQQSWPLAVVVSVTAAGADQ
ncbi:hypothetical protein [Tsukamurella serpentis]